MRWQAIVSAAVAGMAVLSARAQNQDETSRLYIGLDLGRSHLGLGGGDIDNVFLNQGATTVTSTASSNTATGLIAGYRLSRHFAVEGAYAHLGNFAYNSVVSAPAADTIQGSFRANALSLSAVGIMPLPASWSIYGKLGLAYTVSTLSANSVSGVTPLSNGTESTTGLLAGAGATYDFNTTWFGKLGWDHYTSVGGATTGKAYFNVLSLGAGMRF